MPTFHPVAEIFPMLGEAELAALAEDIRQNGLREPIWLHRDGRIIDGRNRFKACELAGANLAARTYEGDDADLVRFVVSLNLHRRHLDESQRAMVAARVANMRQGARTDLEPPANLPEVSQSVAASMLSVSERSVRSARSVVDRGSRELVSAVERGDVSVSAAAEVAALTEDEQREVVARGEREIVRAANEIRARKRAERSIRIESAIAEKTLETATVADFHALAESGRKFGAIYADPPWLYGNQVTRASTGNHYGGMTVAEIADLPVAKLAADSAHLHLWTTNAFLFDCKAIMEAWGFTYKSCMVWVKPQMGIGNYWRVSHEFLLFGIRGDCPFRDHAQKSWLEAPRGAHSAKPDQFRKLIEKVSPGPYLEMFGRRVSPNWVVWGNEIKRTMFDADVQEVA